MKRGTSFLIETSSCVFSVAFRRRILLPHHPLIERPLPFVGYPFLLPAHSHTDIPIYNTISPTTLESSKPLVVIPRPSDRPALPLRPIHPCSRTSRCQIQQNLPTRLRLLPQSTLSSKSSTVVARPFPFAARRSALELACSSVVSTPLVVLSVVCPSWDLVPQ